MLGRPESKNIDKFASAPKTKLYEFATKDTNYKENLTKLGLSQTSKIIKQTKQAEQTTLKINEFLIVENNSATILQQNTKLSMINQIKLKAGNSALGFEALKNSINGGSNCALGHQALLNCNSSSNVAIGYKVGHTLKTGKRNIIIGNNADVSSKDAINQIVIGTKAKGIGNHTMILGGEYKRNKRVLTTKLECIDPGVTDYTDLGSADYKFNTLYTSILNNGQDFTLPASYPSSNNTVLQINKKREMNYQSNQEDTGIVIYGGKTHTVTKNNSGISNITIDDILKADGRLIVDSTSTTINFTCTAAQIIDKLGLKYVGDYITNSFIATNTGVFTINLGTNFNATDSKVTLKVINLDDNEIISTMDIRLTFVRKLNDEVCIRLEDKYKYY